MTVSLLHASLKSQLCNVLSMVPFPNPCQNVIDHQIAASNIFVLALLPGEMIIPRHKTKVRIRSNLEIFLVLPTRTSACKYR